MGLIGEAFCETLWPTRCALCDKPGEVLCEACRKQLDILDLWQACPTCGAPFGFRQCDHCTPIVAGDADTFRCTSALRYTHATGALIKTYKDKGEWRLASVMAALLADAVEPSWGRWAHAVTYVSATKAAQRRRGFDHMELVAEKFSAILGIACMKTLAEPIALDQRELGRTERRANIQGRFSTCAPVAGLRLVLIDDVFTTGSTIGQARQALIEAGASVRCATIARA